MHFTSWRLSAGILALVLLLAQAPGAALAALPTPGDMLNAQYGPGMPQGGGFPYPGVGATGMNAGGMVAPAGQTASGMVAPAGQTGTSGPSTEECARYSGRAALPYFSYALGLSTDGPIPGIPPAQAVTPQYAYGPGPVPGMVAAGPYRPVYPYLPRGGPGALVGGVGVSGGNPLFTARGLTNGFLAGGQLVGLPNPALGALSPEEIVALAGQQATEVGNRIGI